MADKYSQLVYALKQYKLTELKPMLVECGLKHSGKRKHEQVAELATFLLQDPGNRLWSHVLNAPSPPSTSSNFSLLAAAGPGLSGNNAYNKPPLSSGASYQATTTSSYGPGLLASYGAQSKPNLTLPNASPASLYSAGKPANSFATQSSPYRPSLSSVRPTFYSLASNGSPGFASPKPYFGHMASHLSSHSSPAASLSSTPASSHKSPAVGTSPSASSVSPAAASGSNGDVWAISPLGPRQMTLPLPTTVAKVIDQQRQASNKSFQLRCKLFSKSHTGKYWKKTHVSEKKYLDKRLVYFYLDRNLVVDAETRASFQLRRMKPLAPGSSCYAAFSSVLGKLSNTPPSANSVSNYKQPQQGGSFMQTELDKAKKAGYSSVEEYHDYLNMKQEQEARLLSRNEFEREREQRLREQKRVNEAVDPRENTEFASSKIVKALKDIPLMDSVCSEEDKRKVFVRLLTLEKKAVQWYTKVADRFFAHVAKTIQEVQDAPLDIFFGKIRKWTEDAETGILLHQSTGDQLPPILRDYIEPTSEEAAEDDDVQIIKVDDDVPSNPKPIEPLDVTNVESDSAPCVVID